MRKRPNSSSTRHYVMATPIAIRMLVDHYGSPTKAGEEMGISPGVLTSALSLGSTKLIYELAAQHLLSQITSPLPQAGKPSVRSLIDQLRDHFANKRILDVTEEEAAMLGKTLRQVLS